MPLPTPQTTAKRRVLATLVWSLASLHNPSSLSHDDGEFSTLATTTSMTSEATRLLSGKEVARTIWLPYCAPFSAELDAVGLLSESEPLISSDNKDAQHTLA